MKTAMISTRISTAITPPVTPMVITNVVIGEDVVMMEVGRGEGTDGVGGPVIYGNNNWFKLKAIDSHQ